jgi:hypothetical protein
VYVTLQRPAPGCIYGRQVGVFSVYAYGRQVGVFSVYAYGRQVGVFSVYASAKVRCVDKVRNALRSRGAFIE